MKKALAIVNVPDDADISELCITFDLERMLNQDGDVETIWSDISEPLKPFPEMIKISIEDAEEIVAFTKMHEREDISDEMWDAVLRLQDAIEEERG